MSLRNRRRKGKGKRVERKDMKKTNDHSNDLSLGGAPSQVRLVLMVLMATPSQVWGSCITLFFGWFHETQWLRSWSRGIESKDFALGWARVETRLMLPAIPSHAPLAVYLSHWLLEWNLEPRAYKASTVPSACLLPFSRRRAGVSAWEAVCWIWGLYMQLHSQRLEAIPAVRKDTYFVMVREQSGLSCCWQASLSLSHCC